MTICSQVHSWISHSRSRGAIAQNDEIIHIASVRPLWILQAVQLGVRIEMHSSSFECWSLTLSHFMNMNRMHARRKIFEIELNPDTLASSGNSGCTDAFAL